MPISLNEIRDRALRFAREWSAEDSEHAEAKTFWDQFFDVFGVSRRRVASFEAPVRGRADGGRTSTGFIDLFWKGRVLVEHKSRGKNLDRAFQQAVDYFPGIDEHDLPRYILVSDFARFRLYDLEQDQVHEFALGDLPERIQLFGFISGYQSRPVRPQDPVNLQAAERMGRLHDELKDAGYEGHPLEVLLVRLVFCLFADDTRIFADRDFSFRDWIEQRTSPDGSDLGPRLVELFQVLDIEEQRRQKHLDEELARLPHVNGRLFKEALPVPAFNAAMRRALLDACALNWGRISPAIFGALFQSIMKKEARRSLGAHYTSEENILKLIGPLFLDELRAEFEGAKRSTNRLFELQKKLRRLRFLDPACGCGNFLVIAYRELRLLELDILRATNKEKQRYIDIFLKVQVNVDQFYGIEIEEFPVQVAQVALWLTDHQMNQLVSEEFGAYFSRLPLTTAPNIVQGNALRVDWRNVVSPENLDFILGNPPFVGHHYQSASQKEDQRLTLAPISGSGVLDYVANWYLTAAAYMAGNPSIRAALVSTNSIVQGEQVGLLWDWLLARGVRVHFAHQTFRWSNEATGVAAVHCVIIGFGLSEPARKALYEYSAPEAEPQMRVVGNISPYLFEGPNLVLRNRSAPISPVPRMLWGNKPTDGGHLLLSPEEREVLVASEPEAAAYIRPYMGGGDFLNDEERYCLWLVGVSPAQLRSLPEVLRRVEAVREFRLQSKAASTRAYADRPTLFRQIAQPQSAYVAVPEVSSERRAYIPMAFFSPEIICSNTVQFVPDATLYHFGVLSSGMHMAWVRCVCGRLESRFRYSNTIVYNNFPWPDGPSDARKATIEKAAQSVLDARAAFPGSSLADLYDPRTMPPELAQAHRSLDRAVEAAYRSKGFGSDAERVAFLFERYQALTALFREEPAPKVRRRPAHRTPRGSES